MIKGIVQAVKTNDYGFTSIKVSGEWYGSDQKGKKPPVGEGDLVEFEAAKNAKGYMTLTKGTLAKLEKTAQAVAALPAPKLNDRDAYWADKAVADAAKEPKITYFAALDRAISAVDFYVRNGALPLDKVKQPEKLKVLREFIDLETLRISALASTAGVAIAVPGGDVDVGLDDADVVRAQADKKGAVDVAEEAGKW